MDCNSFGAMAGKRAFSIKVQKKGSARRKLRAKGLEWYVIDTGPRLERVPRGHRKAPREILRPKHRVPSGRGISGDEIFITGKKATASGLLSAQPPKPTREARLKRHPKRRHINRRK